MNLSLRLLVGYFLIVGLAAWFVLNIFSEEVRPGVRQSMEETLVDTAHLLAELAAQDLSSGEIEVGHFSSAFQRYQSRFPQAEIWGVKKNSLDFRVYITDADGIVVYDSSNESVGQDYSNWNDVFLTLRGRYGVRSTPTEPDDSRSTVMHVAAPVMYKGKIIGVLTVAKPTLSVQPFIDRSRQRVEMAGWWLMGGALLIGLVFTWWLMHSISLLRHYARNVSQGNKTSLPKLGSGELAELGSSLAEMRAKLDGREYVEEYVHQLAHEMKSPIAALIGSAELLDEDMPQKQRSAFTGNIREQSRRLKYMLDKLLALAKLEYRNSLEGTEVVNLHKLVHATIADQKACVEKCNITCSNEVEAEAKVMGESFLLRQALANLLNNALDFSPDGSCITFSLETDADQYTLIVRDQGEGIPEYALSRIFERFYSLARPGNKLKSSGLGLPFVREVALLHGGDVKLNNLPQGGVEARFILSVNC